MFNSSIDEAHNTTRGAREEKLDLVKLTELAFAGLQPMFNRERHLYCDQLLLAGSGFVQKGLSHRYTMMTLLGLKRYQDTTLFSAANFTETLDNMLRDTAWIDNIGDLGLLLWTCALVWPERLPEVRHQLRINTALETFRGGAKGRTMEVAWFLTGLAHMALAQPESTVDLRDNAVKASQLLLKNQGGHGIFGHLARNGSLAGFLRGSVGSFADQVYPIYALSKFGSVFDQPSAVQAARECAEAICRAQGPLGQWWWHYDATDGRVLEQYPVYSVHQHAMGPMALFALEEASGTDFSGPIYRGLQWVYGKNELGSDMRDSSGVIWRNFYRANKGNVYRDRMRGILKLQSTGVPHDLVVNYECRPYELGWLLYAFAGRTYSAA